MLPQDIDAADQVVTNSLDDLLTEGDHSGRPFNVLVGANMGNRTLVISVPMATFYEISEVANRNNLDAMPSHRELPVAQRRLDEGHAKKLAVFILKGLLDAARRKLERAGRPVPAALLAIQKDLGSQPYISMQPIVANIRNCKPGGEGLRFVRTGGTITVYLSDKHVLWIIDGQHRRFAMHLVFEFLKTITINGKYPRKPALYVPADDSKREPTPEEVQVWSYVFEIARGDSTVVVETHLGLNFEQERQLFHDLNNLAKTVESSLVYEFDNSNPVNRFIKERLLGNDILKAKVVDTDNPHDWHKDEGVISRKDLIAINALLFLNKTTINGASPADINAKEEYGCRFWGAIAQIPYWGEPGAKKNTIAAQPVVLKALAKLVYDFGYGRDENAIYLERIFSAVERGVIDFSHANPMWRYFELTPEEQERVCPGLKDAITPEEAGFNLDLGNFDHTNQVMRFGAKHNDIQRHLGDMIRWKLGLPKRKALAKLQSTLLEAKEGGSVGAAHMVDSDA
ncbi:DNA sulfur modification protein DndB [Siccirubricoccus sp. G192]|uniref:DNA sulfur modification protein DndB n=1 Tax=Siccirubricoccus sp. G192 TaxID=2849651 RepID=UPI001C2C9062|nr:DNA sulfur modification protein DndB [Siccirubricoccus sp. G192]MBV1797486.1 DNA sulfur modification protein DndB [Siccirubricoccus sp. G192]